jgi:hypothetical protein
MSLDKNKIIGISIILIISVFLIRYTIEKYNIEKHSVFVIGAFVRAEKGVKGATRYIYEYQFNGKKYLKKFSGQVSKIIQKDSVMFFKILPNSPSVCRQIVEVRVPKCISLSSVPKEGWKELPIDTCR